MPGIRPFTGRKLTVGRVRGVYTPPTVAASGPAFRSASSTTTTSSTMTCAIPTGTTAGDILVLSYFHFYDSKAGSPASAPTGWTARAFDYNSSGDAFRYYVLTKTAGASESSVTLTGSNWLAGQMNMIAISGGTAVDVVGTLAPNVFSTNLVASSVTTTTASDLLVGIWNAAKIVTERPITAPASMTSRVTTSVNNTWALTSNVATQTLNASGATGSRTATISATANYTQSVLLAVK